MDMPGGALGYGPAALIAAAAGGAAAVLLGAACCRRAVVDAVERDMHQRAISRMPERIILVRHGESEANVDPQVWNTKPDNMIELTERGVAQARAAGKRIKELVGDRKIGCVLSPFWRTNMTNRNILKELSPSQVRETRIEPRVREQEFGNYQEGGMMREMRKVQQRVGRFWYRFPDGESGADVYARVASALWDIKRVNEDRRHRERVDDVVVVTHGLAMRLMLCAEFKWSPDTFHTVYNPDNCEVWVLRKNQDGVYRLSEEGAIPRSSRDIAVHYTDGRVETHTVHDYLSLPQPRTCHPDVVLDRLAIPADDVVKVDYWNGAYNRFD